MGNQKWCYLYAYELSPFDMDFEQELIDFLEEDGYKVMIMRTLKDLNGWMKRPNIVLPSLFITNLTNTEDNFNPINDFLSETTIYCIHEEAIYDECTDNGNTILSFESTDDVMSHLNNEDSEVEEYDDQNAHYTDHFEKKPVEIQDHSVYINEMPPFVESIDSDLPLTETGEHDEEIHRGLKNITEFRNKVKVQQDIVNETPPLVPHTEVTPIKIQEVEKEKDEAPQDAGTSEVNYQENPYFMRSRNLQKQIFNRQQWEDNKMIGIWSPIHRMGVTSLSINFAFFLAQNRVYTAVLEGLTGQHAMKDWLKRYTPVPPNWISYAKAIQTDANTSNTEWTYRNVRFLPLENTDAQYDWNSLSLESYMSTTKIIDVTLVDLPTGVMAGYTQDSLHYLDELWIVVDDAIQETLAWKSYIHRIKELANIPIYLIFNKHYPFSQNSRISKELGISMITYIPSLHEETMQNYYEDTPLYFKDKAVEKLEKPFIELATHLFGGEFTLKKDVEVSKETAWKDKMFKPLRALIKPLKSN